MLKLGNSICAHALQSLLVEEDYKKAWKNSYKADIL